MTSDRSNATRAAGFHALRAPSRVAATCILAALLLTACQDPAEAARAQAAAQARADAAAADEAAAAFDRAVAQQNWPLAKAQGDVLIARWPQTPAAERIAAAHADAVGRAHAAREETRLASLWAYNTQTVEGGQQLSAAIYARDPLDVDGTGAKPVRLIFRDHPDWDRSSYLVLEAGDFRCRPACRVPVTVDDGEPQAMAANRPDTDEAIAMFIDDERALWTKLESAKTLSVEIPVVAGGSRTAVFEVAGLDRTKLPGW